MSVVTLDANSQLESLEDTARKELRETSEVKQAALNDLRRRISDEPSLRCPLDDGFLTKFLRARKYDTQAAFKNVKKYFKFRRDHPEMFEQLTPSCVPYDIVCRTHRLLTVSRRTDPMGRTAVLLRTGAWNTEICKLNDFFRVGTVIFEHLLLREEAQVRGVVIVIDFKGLNIYHLAHFTPSVIRTFISLAQDTLPIRLKGVYMINNPPIFDFFFAIAKTFLKTKLLKRIRLLGYEPKELHQLVPDDVIPEEHGGSNESYDYDLLESELKSAEAYFQALGSCGYCATPTETAHKPNGVLNGNISSREECVHL